MGKGGAGQRGARSGDGQHRLAGGREGEVGRRGGAAAAWRAGPALGGATERAERASAVYVGASEPEGRGWG